MHDHGPLWSSFSNVCAHVLAALENDDLLRVFVWFIEDRALGEAACLCGKCAEGARAGAFHLAALEGVSAPELEAWHLRTTGVPLFETARNARRFRGDVVDVCSA
jgi:hypothetical protein